MTLQKKQYEVVDMTIIIATQTLLYSAPDFFFFFFVFSCGAFVYTNSCLKLRTRSFSSILKVAHYPCVFNQLTSAHPHCHTTPYFEHIRLLIPY